MDSYSLTVYTCPYCGTKSNGSVCLYSDFLRLAELNKAFREATTAEVQVPLALKANKLRKNIQRRSKS